MHSRSSAFAVAGALATAVVVACHSSAPPPPPPPPPALSDSAAAALRWVEPNAVAIQPDDSVATTGERAFLDGIAEGARIIGFSELSEGTHQFPYVIRRSLIALAGSSRVRALAIQAPMPEAMEVDRYVRTGVGEPVRLLRTLNSWRWETREMRALVGAIREYNQGKAAADQIGFYGFEIPTAAHAVEVVTTLRDSVVGASLKAWLVRQYSCVAINEGAHWGLEGRAADSAYWNACAPAVKAALDSVVALRQRVGSRPGAADVAYAEQMAKLIDHHVRTGLRHLERQDLNAEHVLFLADLIGPDAKLMLWGGDIEMGRLKDNKITQTGVPLGEKLRAAYRPIAFGFGDGVLRARAAGPGRGGGEPGLSDMRIARPLANTYEEVFSRVPRAGLWLDMRSLPTDMAGAWLRGPRPMRLITEVYSAQAPEAFQTPVEFPKFFDAVVFVNHVTAAKN
jgi:erythromycin esterase-like protein